METKTAWDLIGFDGTVRVKGGRTLYESVEYNDATPGTHVKLARLDHVKVNGEYKLRQINRYVDPDTKLEVFDRWPPIDPAADRLGVELVDSLLADAEVS